MVDTIKDGTGKGYLVEVTKNNKLRAYCTNESEISFESETNEQAYTWTNVSYNYTAGDTILLVKNTNSTKNLLIQAIEILLRLLQFIVQLVQLQREQRLLELT